MTALNKEMAAAIVLVALEYGGVFLAIMADLWSGWRKAVAAGEKRTSKALRRTVDKVARYYNALISLTVLDAMVMAAAFYIKDIHGWHLTAFPVFSLIGALGLTLIEIKSICENTGKKKELKHISSLINTLLKHADSHEIIQSIMASLNDKKSES